MCAYGFCTPSTTHRGFERPVCVLVSQAAATCAVAACGLMWGLTVSATAFMKHLACALPVVANRGHHILVYTYILSMHHHCCHLRVISRCVLLALLLLRALTCHCACGESCVHHLHYLLLAANLSFQRTCTAAIRKQVCHLIGCSYCWSTVLLLAVLQRTCRAAGMISQHKHRISVTGWHASGCICMQTETKPMHAMRQAVHRLCEGCAYECCLIMHVAAKL
jgi:hypothetical protein